MKSKKCLAYVFVYLVLASITMSSKAAFIQYAVDATIKELDHPSVFSFTDQSLAVLAAAGITEGTQISIILNIDDSKFPIQTSNGSVALGSAFFVSSLMIGPVQIDTYNYDLFVDTSANSGTSHNVAFNMLSEPAGPFSGSSLGLQFTDTTQTAIGPLFHPDDIEVTNFGPFSPLGAGPASTGFFMFVAAGNSQGFVQAEINSFQRVVPVPAAIWLLGGALGVLGVVKRRSTSHSKNLTVD